MPAVMGEKTRKRYASRHTDKKIMANVANAPQPASIL